MENWKKLNDLNYEISDLGRIRNFLSKKILKQSLDNRGYLRVSLSTGSRGIPKIGYPHRLVAEYFIENPLNKPQVNHIDGDKTNNIASNLEWVSPKENTIHAVETGLFKSKEISKKANLASLEVNSKIVRCKNISSGEEIIFPSISEASRQMSIPYSTLQRKIKQKIIYQGYLFSLL